MKVSVCSAVHTVSCRQHNQSVNNIMVNNQQNLLIGEFHQNQHMLRLLPYNTTAAPTHEHTQYDHSSHEYSLKISTVNLNTTDSTSAADFRFIKCTSHNLCWAERSSSQRRHSRERGWAQLCTWLGSAVNVAGLSCARGRGQLTPDIRCIVVYRHDNNKANND